MTSFINDPQLTSEEIQKFLIGCSDIFNLQFCQLMEAGQFLQELELQKKTKSVNTSFKIATNW